MMVSVASLCLDGLTEWSTRKRQLADIIAQQPPHLIALQGCTVLPARQQVHGLVRSVNERLPRGAALYTAHANRSGQAIMTTLPAFQSDTLSLAGQAALRLVVALPNGAELAMISAEFDPTPDAANARYAQATALLGWLDHPSKAPYQLVGGALFATRAEQSVDHLLTVGGFQLAYELCYQRRRIASQPTGKVATHGRCTDYLLCSQSVDAVPIFDAWAVKPTDGRYVSTHVGLIAALTLRA